MIHMLLLLSFYLPIGIETGNATIYYPNDGHCGKWKADGTRFRKTDRHIAHRRLPLKTWGIICSLRTGLCADTSVRDRGPYGAIISCNRYRLYKPKGGIGKPKRYSWSRTCFYWQAQIRLHNGWKRRGNFDITRPVARDIKHKAFEPVLFIYLLSNI